MDNRRFGVIAALGCLVLLVLGGLLVAVAVVGPLGLGLAERLQQEREPTISVSEVTREVEQAVPTITVEAPEEVEIETTPPGALAQVDLTALYEEVNPGVVNVRVFVQRQGRAGQGAGSGFLYDDEGHIVTNQHVVADAEIVSVIFYDGFETQAEVVGTDPDSDLAVLRVNTVPEDAHALPIGQLENVRPGDWVIAIGNPFRLGGTMTIGIVSAVGRTIPTAETPFSIPQAIQTDAAINPGNSGGPLLSLAGEVVGVNAQIATQTGANVGVGFAIPANVVRRVVPALIERGEYVWPWLGVEGGTLNLAIQEANDLQSGRGAYIVRVVDGGPADQAGLQGATGQESVFGVQTPVGGDVVVQADDEPIEDFADLLTYIAFQRPGDTVTLTVLRDGEREQVEVELAARPENFRQ